MSLGSSFYAEIANDKKECWTKELRECETIEGVREVIEKMEAYYFTE